MVSRLRPCFLERQVLPKPWGGRALERLLGRSLPPGESIGETWEVFDRKEGSSRLLGPDTTLAAWMAEARAELLGAAAPTADGRFPLLIKLIDAREALSVQVHPDDDLARAEGDSGKSEAWVVLEAGPKARIICGLKPGTERAEFARVAHTSEVEAHLHAFAPRVGQAIDVPAGVVHAIGPDVVVYEIQQNSDLTYRLYDWGRPREVHVEKALRATRFDVEPCLDASAVPTDGGGEWLFRNRAFTLRRFALSGPVTLPTEESFKIATVLTGRGTLGWRSAGEDLPLPLGPGDTVLVPACTGTVFVSPVGGMTMLWAGPGSDN